MVAPGRAPVQPKIPLGVNLPSRVPQGQVGSAVVTTWGAQGRGPRSRPILLQPGPALGSQHTNDRQTNALQEALRVSTSVAKSNPLGSCVLLQNLSFPSAQTVLVPHGLGRAFVSAVVCGQSSNSGWSIQRPSGIAQDTQYIAVTTYGPLNFDLLVF